MTMRRIRLVPPFCRKQSEQIPVWKTSVRGGSSSAAPDEVLHYHVAMMLTGVLQMLWPVLPPKACAWMV